MGGISKIGDIISSERLVMDVDRFEENLEEEFHVSRYIIIYKFVLGVLELLLGLGIIFLGKKILELYEDFKTRELLEDPHDLLVNILERVVPYFAQHQGFIILILLALGIVKMIGSVGLLYHKSWGLDLLVGLTLFLLPLESFRLLSDPSPTKLAYLLINILIALYLVNFKPKEYFSNLRNRLKTP